ncbi:TniQ family protein [Deinococcus marmoris]|uniref:TniQ family protein n=1 Tax=Deinococcus marmoris TaxID=249408 RepID=UPI0004966FBF|nr:TniQ family protein [Deinococcus marmoris]
MNRLRPLSTAIRPLEGPEGPEAFASYVDRLAAGQLIPVPVSTIMYHTGLISEDAHDARMPVGYGIDLSPGQRLAFARACRLTPENIQQMLLRDLDGVVFDLTGLNLQDINSIMTVTRNEWSGASGSACCPACLEENGAWRLRWKLWTSFVCLTHGLLLVARCPRCERRTGNYRPDLGNQPRFITHVPVPGLCANPLGKGVAGTGRASRPCGCDLREVETADLSSESRLLEAQHKINAVLDGAAPAVLGEPVTPVAYFGHLRSLLALARHAGQPGDLGTLPLFLEQAWQQACEGRDDLREVEAGKRGTAFHAYKAAPDDPRLVAAILPWAVELLASPDQAGITEGLRPLVERSRTIRGSAVRALGRDFHLDGPLAAALNEVMAHRALTHRTVGHLAASGTGEYRTFKTEHVPQLIWQEDYDRDFRPLLEGLSIEELSARVAVSMALVRLTGQYSVADSAFPLGLGGLFKGASTNPMMIHLGQTGDKDAFARALHTLATRLEGPGPHRDYRAAQQALEDFVELDADAWENCRNAAGLQPTKSAALQRNAAAWIWAQILSSHPNFSPALRSRASAQASAREMYRRFEATHLNTLREALTVQARWMEEELGLAPPSSSP